MVIAARYLEILAALTLLVPLAVAVICFLDQRECKRIIAESEDRMRVLDAMWALSEEELAERWER